MQPLAIPPITNPTDAGEASNVGSAHSNKTSDVGFNDLMAAARASAEKRRAADQEFAAKRSSEHAKIKSEDKEAETAVDALSAAAKFASRNVKLKQRAAEEERNRSAPDKKTVSKTPADSQADALPYAEMNATAKPAKAETSSEDKLSEPASVASQPEATRADNVTERDVEQSYSTALIAKGPLSDIAEGALSHEAKFDANVNSSEVADSADLSPESMAQPETLVTKDPNQLTLKADEPNSNPSDDDVTTARNASLAALTGSAKEILSTAVKAGVQTNEGDTAHQQESQSIAGLENALTEKGADEEGAPATAPLATVSDAPRAETSNIASLVAPTAPNNPAAAYVEKEGVLTQGRRQNPDQSFNLNRADTATQDPNKSNGDVSSTPHALQIDPDQRLAAQSTLRETDVPRVSKFDIGSKTASDQGFDAPTSGFDNTSTDSDDDAPQHQQMMDKRPTVAQQLKAVTGAISSTQNNAQGKNTVSVEKLAKLGISEASVSIGPSTFVGTEAQEQTIAPPPLATTTVQPQVQTSEAGASNSASNLERRTIAADIRLRALERMVVAAARAGTESITLQLYPPGLGQVMIRLVMDGQKLRIMTRAANAEAVDALKEMEGDLRHALAGDGLDLAAFDVTDEKSDGEQDRRQKPAETAARSSGPSNESFTVDLNA